MASFNSGSHPGAPSFESLLVQNLMSRLQLRPPYLDTNSFLSQSLDDFLLQDELLSLEDKDEPPYGSDEERGLLAREEAKLEKEIVRIIRSGTARDALKPNSGQSVAIGDHNICVGYHEEPGSEYRVWEWHGHIVLFDEESGFSPEYIYGNYFERVPLSAEPKEGGEGEEEKKSAHSGLRALIGDEMDSAGKDGRRVLHRNSLSTGSSC